MKVLAVALALVASTVVLRAQGCGTDIQDKERGEACTRTGECVEGLTCIGGICDSRDTDGGADGG